MWTTQTHAVNKVERQVAREARRAEWGPARMHEEIDQIRRQIDRAQRGLVPVTR